MAEVIEFYVPEGLRQKTAQRSLEYGKLIEFCSGGASPSDDSVSSGNLLALLLEKLALHISGDSLALKLRMLDSLRKAHKSGEPTTCICDCHGAKARATFLRDVTTTCQRRTVWFQRDSTLH